MADEKANSAEGMPALGMLEGRRDHSRRSVVESERAKEDMADLRIAEKRLRDIEEGRSSVYFWGSLGRSTPQNPRFLNEWMFLLLGTMRPR